MNENEKTQFAEIMAGLGEIFDKTFSKVAIEMYWNALSPYSLNDIKRATNNIVCTHKYATFPKPAEFIEYIDPPQDAEIKAELMTKEFYERFANSGYESFEWQDPILAMAVDHYGGWHKVLELYPRHDATEAMFWLKDFKKMYIAFLKHPIKSVRIRVVGKFEADNIAKGYLTDEKGSVISLPESEGFIMIGSPDAQKYLEVKEQKQIESRISTEDGF